MVKHFLSIADCTTQEIKQLLEESAAMKKFYPAGDMDNCLTGKTMAMLFEKPSSRTRISFQVAMTQLGGSSIYIRPSDIGGLGQREPIKDLTRVLNGYVNIIVARTFSHDSVLELARYAEVPVVNALTDLAHPCQAMADVLTIQEHFGKLEGLKVAFIGDGNNVACSLALVCLRLGMTFSIASPEGYSLPEGFVSQLGCVTGGDNLICTQSPVHAVKDADVIYTDTWISMGQEHEKEQRMKIFADYQVNKSLMESTGRDTKVMHCLPAYRGLEITDEVIESPQSIIFDQAENRLHFQRALVKHLLCS